MSSGLCEGRRCRLSLETRALDGERQSLCGAVAWYIRCFFVLCIAQFGSEVGAVIAVLDMNVRLLYGRDQASKCSKIERVEYESMKLL